MEKIGQKIWSAIMARIEEWKSRLIDLSRRNPLLFFRRTKSGNLSVSRPYAETIFNGLVVKKRSWEFWLPPEEPENSGQLKLVGEKQPLIESNPARANQLVCEGMDRKDLERILKNLNRRSLSDYREKGVRILHTAFGMLVWKENETSEEIRSPLILVPVELTRESVREPFNISVPQVEEEAILNPALQVRMKNDFNIELPALPEEWDMGSLAGYLDEIRSLVKGLGWKVEDAVEIGLFSFYKLVIYKDLEANSELIAQHPLIRAIVGDKDVRCVQDSLPEEKDVDKIEVPETTFQVLDADSSQRVAIDYALRGQSFVMQGPPGTGKSQTIANIIAECIAQGRTVLFVSDKMAALEVVYKRLSEVGLAHFCLAIHSSKANKQEVVAELKRCLDEQLVPHRLPSKHDFEKMHEMKERLNDYVVSLHEKRQPLDKSAYEVLGQISALEQVPFFSVGLRNPRDLAPQRLRELEEMMSQSKNVWQAVEEKGFPWVGYRGKTYDIQIRSEISKLLDNIITTIDLLESESARFCSDLGLDRASTLDRMKWLVGLSNLLMESPGPEANWITNGNFDELVSETKNYQEVCDWCRKTRSLLMERYGSSFFGLTLEKSTELHEIILRISKAINSTNAEEGKLLEKREEFLDFVRNTQALTKQWDETTRSFASSFGLPREDMTLERVKQLSRLAILCFSEDRPEKQWLDPLGLQKAQETLSKTRIVYGEHNSLRNKLEETYTEGIFKLDFDALITRYSGPHKSFLKWLQPSYHRDQKQIGLTSRSGHAPSSVLSDLVDAQKVKKLSEEIDRNAESVRDVLGHFHKGYDTDFQQIDKAVQIAQEIISLSGVSPVPESLAKLVSYGSNPEPSMKLMNENLQESMIRFDRAIETLGSLVPLSNMPNSNLSLYQTPLVKLQNWAGEMDSNLFALCEKTKEVLAPCKKDAPRNYEMLLEDLRNEENVRKKEAEFIGKKEYLQQKFGRRFSDLDTNWEEILSILEWTKKVHASFQDTPIPESFVNVISRGASSAPSNHDLVLNYENLSKFMTDLQSHFENELSYQGKKLQEMDMKPISDRVKFLRNRVDDVQVWIDFKDIRERFSQNGLDGFFSSLTENPPAASQLVDVFRRGAYQEWVNSVYEEDPCLGRFRRENHEQLIAEFKKLDEELIRLSSARVMQAANERKPQDILIQAGDSEVNILLREAAKKRRLMPIRNLLHNIPHILFKLKPCLLMSPISVSQFLDPTLKFDLVLFDEASQIVPEDAIGAIYRGKTIVVAGDDQQLPPTSFFQKITFDDDDWDEISDEGEVFDSILDEFHGIGLPVKTLRWHYRSKHEGLISFSNHRFYGDTLITFPSAVAKDEALGVKMVYVPDGIYDRGGRRDNVKEAERVSDLVFEHFRQYPKKTLGVVTFSVAQKDAVEEAIERRLKEQPEFERYFKEDRLGGFFVKNLENVQGDERDVMIFSVGYGRDGQGLMTMNFGPLNKPGGERRLNVAVTRAREKVVLVASIKASDFDPDATSAAGVLTLYHYLDYAERGSDALKLTHPQSGEFESPLEEDVAKEIRRMGYNVIPQVGCGGYRIDLGVTDPANPGRFILGVECDGATYHSSSTARDRDRLREQVLRNLGWNIFRVWAPTWVARRESEVRRLKQTLEQTRELKPAKSIAEADPDPIEIEKSQSQEVDVQRVHFGGIERIGVPYRVCQLTANFSSHVYVHISRYPYRALRKNEFHLPQNREQQNRLLAELVTKEGPVHFEYAVQRLAEAWGIKRAGHKVVRAVNEALRICERNGTIRVDRGFLWPAGLNKATIRVPVESVPNTLRKPEHIPPEEIQNAMIEIVQYALGIGVESLLVETARVFGFNRTGEKVRARFLEIYEELLKKKKLVCTNDIVTMP